MTTTDKSGGSSMDGFMTILKATPEQDAEIKAHWEKVRAGFHKTEPYEFSTDTRHLANMHRARAMLAFNHANKQMKRVMDFDQ